MQQQTVSFPLEQVEYMGEVIFNNFDRDRSGSLDMSEFPGMINMFFT
jgi:hypothetical protein